MVAIARNKQIGPRLVPIVPDEARTFGMEGMFRQLGIYSSRGQLYEPTDSGQVMYYREDKTGQVMEITVLPETVLNITVSKPSY